MTIGLKSLTIGNKYGFVQGTSWNGVVENNVPLCQGYGFASAPPQNTELCFLETEGGLIACCERYKRPACGDGEVFIYDSNGAEMRFKNATSSRRINIGKGGDDAAHKRAARKGDTVKKDSKRVLVKPLRH